MISKVHQDSTIHLRRDGFKILRSPCREAEEVLFSLLPDPDILLRRGEPVKSAWQNQATEKLTFRLDGETYFLKKYNCMGLRYRIKNAFRFSRAAKSWRAAYRFRVCGIPTPQPLLCLDERRFRKLYRSYLLFRFVENSVNFLDFWPLLNQKDKEECLSRLAGTLSHMHRQGIYHGDLNWRNILVSVRQGKAEGFYLVDLDGCRFSRKIDVDRGERDLDHFLRDLRRADEGGWEPFFLNQWRAGLNDFHFDKADERISKTA